MLKINNLERHRFSEKIDWEGAFPKKSSQNFLNQVRQNWQNLERGEVNKKGNAALRLYNEFRPAKGRIDKFTIFSLWLYLCLNRPWERNWKVIISDYYKGKARISKRDNETQKNWIKLDEILDQLEIGFPDYPQIHTLRRYTKRKDFKNVITWTAADPGVSVVIGKMFIEGAKAFERMAEGSKDKHIDYKSLKLNFKFANYVRSQKHVKKRDLMRKLMINKKECDLLLTEAVNQNFIKLKEFSQNTVWITYTGPKT